MPGAMQAVGGTGRLQSQVSDSPCCFAHSLTPPPWEPNPNPARMRPLTAAGGLAADTRAELASFVYSLCLQPHSHAEQ